MSGKKIIDGIAFSIEGLKRDADEIEACGAGNEAAQMRWAAAALSEAQATIARQQVMLDRALESNGDALAEMQRLRDERDRFEAALGRACLVGGTTYLVERAEKAEAERADEWRRRRDADASRDAAKAACETMRAERDAALEDLGRVILSLPTGMRLNGAVEGVKGLRAERDAALARVEKLRHQITEASDPDFIWGALDNVNDMDVTLDQFAAAASRAIRAALEAKHG